MQCALEVGELKQVKVLTQLKPALKKTSPWHPVLEPIGAAGSGFGFPPDHQRLRSGQSHLFSASSRSIYELRSLAR